MICNETNKMNMINICLSIISIIFEYMLLYFKISFIAFILLYIHSLFLENIEY